MQIPESHEALHTQLTEIQADLGTLAEAAKQPLDDMDKYHCWPPGQQPAQDHVPYYHLRCLIGRALAHPGVQKREDMLMETTCDYCHDPLEPGEGEFSWKDTSYRRWVCINPDCKAKYEAHEGRLVLISAPIEEQ